MKLIKQLFLFSIFVFINTMPIVSQNIIRPKISGPNDTWVNSYNGVLFFGRTDMETRNSAMPMQLRFYYNSSSNNVDYGYGRGFSLGYQMRYQLLGDELIAIETGDGRSDEFTRYGKEFQAPAGVFSTLMKNGDNIFVLTEKTGEKYVFGDTIYCQVTKIYDRFGNLTELTYQDSLLIKITDAVGHTIDLSYNAEGLLSSAKASFQNGDYKYEYDASRQLRKIIDPLGNITLYDYTKDGRLNEITDANGNKTIIGYNNAGMVSRLKTNVSDKSIRYDGDKTVFIDYTAPSNQYSYYRWDGKGRVIEKVGLCCGTQSTLEYDIYDNVIKRVDGKGNATEYTYDKQGNMLSQIDALGNTEKYTYETIFNQITSFTDKNGNSYQFNYNEKGSLTSLSGPLGFSMINTYDSHGWLLTSTDANGNVSVTTYNPDGTIAETMDPAGNKTKYAYDSYGNIISITDARNNTTTYTYDALGRVTSQTDALGATTSVSYDKIGNIVRVKDALNHITAYTYDALGNILTKTDAMGRVYTYTYDGKENVISIKNPLGQVQTMTYNDHNKLTSVTNPAGEKTSYNYDVKGNLTSMSLPNGNAISYWYDEIDRVTAIDDNLGTIAEYIYDRNGNLLTVTDGLKRTITYTYDALNRKISETLPSGAKTTYTYDNNSNLLSIVDALGNTTQYTYNSLDKQLSHIDALNAKTTFEYDAVGNLVKATDAKGNATTWTYDAQNRNTLILFANGKSLQYTYDGLGNVVASKDRAGKEFKYTYNSLGNLLTKTYPDGTTDKYTYDAISRMLSAVNKDATVTFSYDSADRLSSETLNGKTTKYSYDIALGKRIFTYPSGMQVEEHLNARDLITSILQNGEEVVCMAYNVAGQKTQQTYANGITTNYDYNENGWLQEIKANNDIMHLQMEYNAVGNITKRIDALNDERTESYGYDVIGQLTSFKRGTSVDKSYQFDLLGNRIKTLENGVTTNYTANNINAYTNITGGMNITPQYDDNGNMLNDDKHTYKYDYNNKLIGFDDKDGIYKYDALGRRIAKDKTLFYYVGDQMVEEVTGGVTTSYLYGDNIDETLQMKKGNEVYYYHTNHLGSTMAITKKDGGVQERVEYDVYGMPSFFDVDGEAIAESTIDNTILFTGREYDAETGYYYFRARTQHPAIGRFMQKDPLMYIDGMNDYNYVKNSSIIFYDKLGQQVTSYKFWWGGTIYRNLDYGKNKQSQIEFDLALPKFKIKLPKLKTPCERYAENKQEDCRLTTGCDNHNRFSCTDVYKRALKACKELNWNEYNDKYEEYKKDYLNYRNYVLRNPRHPEYQYYLKMEDVRKSYYDSLVASGKYYYQ